jgi:hypothetical protein
MTEPITEKAIRELLEHASFSSASIALDPRDISQICTRLLEAEAENERLLEMLQRSKEAYDTMFAIAVEPDGRNLKNIEPAALERKPE